MLISRLCLSRARRRNSLHANCKVRTMRIIMCLVSRACLPYPYETSGSRNRAQVPRPSSQLPEFQTAVPLTTTPYYRDPCRKPSSSRIFKRQGFLTGLASATALSNISETLPLASTSPVKRHRLGDSKDRPDHTLDTRTAPRYEDNWFLGRALAGRGGNRLFWA
jgi:hypothetical protein